MYSQKCIKLNQIEWRWEKPDKPIKEAGKLEILHTFYERNLIGWNSAGREKEQSKQSVLKISNYKVRSSDKLDNLDT